MMMKHRDCNKLNLGYFYKADKLSFIYNNKEREKERFKNVVLCLEKLLFESIRKVYND